MTALLGSFRIECVTSEDIGNYHIKYLRRIAYHMLCDKTMGKSLPGSG